MTRAYASTVIDAGVDTVWGLVRDFGAVGRWIPGCKGCDVLVDIDPTRPVRRLVLADEDVVEEVLLTRDDLLRRIQYGFPGQLPRGMRSFIGTAQVREVTDGDRTFIEWSSEFDTDQEWESKMIANISGMLTQIIAAVAAEAQGKGRSNA
ncbi:SRPBCC family protein [Mycobacterium saskatchewanense]|uniref:Polyketide cyclase n=1 Tax=Mycobacterium saskatchewanense TaxID=220927 RepID=A0AAJ3NRP4_9MYCO|nr:SRPBCC family protein [Mycobacterium saskatchewanense]ORW72883.1 hypothetical protein AWC23_08475 [Mycobacterium saskatchewanense]